MTMTTRTLGFALLSAACLALTAWTTTAQTNVQRVHSFGLELLGEGHRPMELAVAPDGTCYGVTALGGPGNRGSVFRLGTNRITRTTLYQFGSNPALGVNPKSILVGSDGRLYGLAALTFGVGVVWRMDTNGLNYTVLRQTTDQAVSLIEASEGRLYYADGGVVGIDRDGGNAQTVATGAMRGVIEGQDRLLYAWNGLTLIRKLTKDGASITDIITSFPPDELGVDADEVSHLRQGADGFLYGLASELSGGTGYFFRADTNGGSRAQVRYTAAARANAPTSFFQSPSDGLFYVSASGGSGFRGGLFAITTNFVDTNLLNWPAVTGGEAGAFTRDFLVEDSDGSFLGATDLGGTNLAGLLFRVQRTGAGFTSLLNFTPSDGPDGTNGAPPVILGTDGFLYGTTRGGGLNNRGVIYRLSTTGTGYTVVKRFASDGEGIDPAGGVVDGKDGFLYGMTVAGGLQNLGTVFKLRYDGSQFSVIYNIRTNRPNAATPQDPTFCAGALIADATSLYGVGLTGGSAGRGAIFAARKDGSLFTNIHNFIVGEARRPFAGLIEGLDGKLYGLTESGGANDAGVFYRMNKDGSGFQVLRAFGDGTDGTNPDGPLWQDTDGVLYGTTFGGGINGFGTAFRINPDGTGYALIHHFGAGVDGRRPTCALAPGPNGTLLGTTRFGGSGPVGSQFGTIFQMSKDGFNYERLRSFTGLNGDGATPQQGLVAVSSNNFFVGTLGGGSVALGSIQQLAFSDAPPPPPLVLATPPGVNATIPCGQPAVVRAPAYNGGCAPITIASNFVSTGSSCARTNRVTWIATDTCGQSLTNSQTIVVTDTAPPFLITPAGENMTVNCGQAVVFTAPIYADACSGVVNVTSNLVSLGANCPQTNVMTWIAMDLCGNSVTNTQTIVVSTPVIPPPGIVTQPVSVIGPPGYAAALSLVATSAPPLTYVWTFNGQALAHATNAVIEIVIGADTAGAYAARVIGPGGSVESLTASVTLFGAAADRSLKLHGAAGFRHRIEFTDSLTFPAPAWETLTNVTLPATPLILNDPAIVPGGRFYRAILP